jgi:activator of HSP90 ATPase
MPRERIELKYTFNCDPYDLYYALHKPEILANWLAEKVEFDESTGIYTFIWSDFSESARLIEKDEARFFLKWKWVEGDHEPQEYISMRVGEPDEDWYVDLYIEDYCERGEEGLFRENWDAQMIRLSRAIM